MPLRSHLEATEWNQLAAELDKRIAEASRHYVTYRLGGDIGQVRLGFDELLPLRGGAEPDYDRPSLPVPYALQYMPQRVASVVAALCAAPAMRSIAAVLDIGSGTDATAIAIDLAIGKRTAPLITAWEPSTAMREFAQAVRCSAIKRTWYPKGLNDVITLGWSARRPGIPKYDLIVLSACLPYGWNKWADLVRALRNLAADGAALVVIEPQSKSGLLDSIGTALAATGVTPDRFCCHDLPDVYKAYIELPESDRIRRSADGPYICKMWPGLRDERFLTCILR